MKEEIITCDCCKRNSNTEIKDYNGDMKLLLFHTLHHKDLCERCHRFCEKLIESVLQKRILNSPR